MFWAFCPPVKQKKPEGLSFYDLKIGTEFRHFWNPIREVKYPLRKVSLTEFQSIDGVGKVFTRTQPETFRVATLEWDELNAT